MRSQDGAIRQPKCHSQKSTAGSTESPKTTLSTTKPDSNAQAIRPARRALCLARDCDPVSMSRVPPDKAAYDPNLSLAGDGPPLVLVPGMDGTGRLFSRQVPLLARRYRVATYGLRDDADSMAILVDDLAAVIRAVAPRGTPAVVGGESFE